MFRVKDQGSREEIIFRCAVSMHVEIFGQTSKYVGGAEERDGGGVVGVHGRGL